jgi:HSP20 family protein
VDQQRGSVDDLLRRVAIDDWSARPGTEAGGTDSGPQRIPVNIYETDEDIVIVAPMPGVEAENVDIEVLGSTVTLSASLRGPGQEDRRYLLHEWTYGPYERTITLPIEIDAQHANASHGNGILVLSLPKASRTKAVHVPLRQVSSSQATHQGHSGHHSRRQGLDSARGS